MVSGLLGAGFTGSYIFSQTIFSMRAHVQSKLHGLIIAGGTPRGRCPSLEMLFCSSAPVTCMLGCRCGVRIVCHPLQPDPVRAQLLLWVPAHAVWRGDHL